jgi:ferredoxin
VDGSIQITNLSESVFPLLLNQVPFPQKAKPAMLDIISGEDKVIPVIKDNPRGIWLGFPGLCKGCGLCIHKCPTKVIHWSNELGVYGHQGFSQRWKAVYSVACAKWSVLTVQFESRKNQYKIKNSTCSRSVE